MTAPYRLKTAGLTVNLRVQGAGPPLLFLGGSNFDLSIRAPGFDSLLPQHFTMAAADPRGLGATDAPEGEWKMQTYAQDALDLLNALGWDRADILGESFGAMVALHLAALAPTRINRLALAAGSPGGAGGSSYQINRLLNIADPYLRARTALSIKDCRFTEQSTEAAEQAILGRIHSDAAFMASHSNAVGYPRLLRARAAHDAWAKLPGITAHTLVFAGRYDCQAPLSCASNIAKAMPNATLHIVEGDHGLCFGRPEPVETLIECWT